MRHCRPNIQSGLRRAQARRHSHGEAATALSQSALQKGLRRISARNPAHGGAKAHLRSFLQGLSPNSQKTPRRSQRDWLGMPPGVVDSSYFLLGHQYWTTVPECSRMSAFIARRRIAGVAVFPRLSKGPWPRTALPTFFAQRKGEPPPISVMFLSICASSQHVVLKQNASTRESPASQWKSKYPPSDQPGTSLESTSPEPAPGKDAT